MSMDERYGTFEAVEERLQAIVDEVSREDISLDDALALYEEAAKLTGVACTLSEQGIEELCPPDQDEAEGEGAGPSGAGSAPGPDAAPVAAGEPSAPGQGSAEAAEAPAEASAGADAGAAADEAPSAR